MNKIVIIIVFAMFISCTHRYVDPFFNNDFMGAINTIDEYDRNNYSITGKSVSDSILVKFYFSQSYLNHLTGTFANVQFLDEVPYYRNRKEFEKDKAKWLKWYENNKYRITKEYSDSVKQVVWDSHIWW